MKLSVKWPNTIRNWDRVQVYRSPWRRTWAQWIARKHYSLEAMWARIWVTPNQSSSRGYLKASMIKQLEIRNQTQSKTCTNMVRTAAKASSTVLNKTWMTTAAWEWAYLLMMSMEATWHLTVRVCEQDQGSSIVWYSWTISRTLKICSSRREIWHRYSIRVCTRFHLRDRNQRF